MDDPLSLLTIGWYAWYGGISIAVAFVLRLFEHSVWWLSLESDNERKARDRPDKFIAIHFPQCLLFGAAFGYILVAVVALYFKNKTVVETSALLVPGAMAFLGGDLRDFIRRYKGN